MLKCSSSLVLLKELQGDVSLELLGGSDVESTSCWKLRVSEDDEDRLENKDNKDGFVPLSCCSETRGGHIYSFTSTVLVEQQRC